jgi:hypothetical protein
MRLARALSCDDMALSALSLERVSRRLLELASHYCCVQLSH